MASSSNALMDAFGPAAEAAMTHSTSSVDMNDVFSLRKVSPSPCLKVRRRERRRIYSLISPTDKTNSSARSLKTCSRA